MAIIPPQKSGEAIVTVDTALFPEGEYALLAKACQDGFEGVSEGVGLRIDRTEPDIFDLVLKYGCWDALTLDWGAPVDVIDGIPFPVSRQGVRYSNQPFLWEEGLPLDVGEPLPPGERDEVTVTDLTGEADWYFKLRAWDEAGNWSESGTLLARTEGEVLHLGGRVLSDLALTDGMTYYVSEPLTVAPGVTLTIGGDTTLKLNRGAWIGVEDATSAIILQGRSGHPVIVTSGADEWAGEPLNGSYASPEACDHEGIVLNGDSSVDEARIR